MKPGWKDAPEWAKYLAMDEDGGWWWHENRPTRDGYLSWYSNGKREYCDLEVPSWRDSLEERPDET